MPRLSVQPANPSHIWFERILPASFCVIKKTFMFMPCSCFNHVAVGVRTVLFTRPFMIGALEQMQLGTVPTFSHLQNTLTVILNFILSLYIFKFNFVNVYVERQMFLDLNF